MKKTIKTFVTNFLLLYGILFVLFLLILFLGVRVQNSSSSEIQFQDISKIPLTLILFPAVVAALSVLPEGLKQTKLADKLSDSLSLVCLKVIHLAALLVAPKISCPTVYKPKEKIKYVGHGNHKSGSELSRA